MAIFVWPAVALILGLVFLFLYKKPLERLLDRTKKITAAGLEASAASQETAIEKRSGAEELLARFERTELLAEREDLIRRELDSRRIDSPAERERVLVRHLAAAYLYAYFDNCYRLIFGSQLTVLQELNSSSPSLKESLRAHYEVAKVESPDFYANYSFDQWLHFLVSRTLLRMDGDYVSITVAGREFLKFVVQEGLSFNKLG